MKANQIKVAKVLSLVFTGLLCSAFVAKVYLTENETKSEKALKILVLGVAQDAGAPHIGCVKECCEKLRSKNEKRNVASLAIIDEINACYWVIDATPDFPDQLSIVKERFPEMKQYLPEGVLLTHAHIGHYTGLMYSGREGMNADHMKVYAMPGMKKFLRKNGPWSQLCEIGNIELTELEDDVELNLSDLIKVVPFTVPHRDEYSETVGYEIHLNGKKVIYLPDIDNWTKMPMSVRNKMQQADLVFFDATFYSADELPGRLRSEIPHPEVKETIDIVSKWKNYDTRNFVFIHINHSNPLLNENSEAFREVNNAGFSIAKTGQVFTF